MEIINHKGKYYLKTETGHREVLATTDESLRTKYKENNHQHLSKYNYILPQPSQQFIQKYIEEYNKGNIITDVLVEYDVHKNSFIPLWIPKVNPKDNTITIKKVKDSWNREEILNDIEQAIIQGLDIGQYRDKWIKENL